MKMHGLALTGAALCLSAAAAAQPGFTYADIAAGKFTQKTVSGVRSMADGLHYTAVKDGLIIRYAYADGAPRDTLCDTRKVVGDAFADYSLSRDERIILLRHDSRPLYRRSAYSKYTVYNRDTGTAAPLTERDSIRLAVISPDGRRAAYVWRNDIYIVEFAADYEERITDDGSPGHILNGVPDWVYEEEFGLEGAMSWSPSGDYLAFLRSDESAVKEFTISRFDKPESDSAFRLPRYSAPYTYKYPVAGERNSTVSLHVYDVKGGLSRHVDTGPEADQYIPYFGWTPAGDLYFYRLNRRQNELDVILTERGGSGGRIIYSERSPKYIDQVSPGTIRFLSDSKRFVVRNETNTGFYHLFLYHIDKGVLKQLTDGEWEVTETVYADDVRVVYLSAEESPLRRSLYSIGTNGRGKRKLSGQEGTYRIAPSTGFRYYISYFSNARTPNTVTLHDGNGRLIRVLEDNAALKDTLARIGVPAKEFFRVTPPEGNPLNGYIIRPPDFDSTRRWPVLMTQYSGPGSQQVADRWSIDWEDVLPQYGYVVVCIDPRGTGYRGEQFKKMTYGHMGDYETSDQIYAARWLASKPWVDPGRLGIYGWSYGGFMALNCILKGADVFKLAIAVAPVTSWRFYDSVYTERYNGLPQDNASGYDSNSPVNFAEQLKGRLLIIHGTADDNVHILNSYNMAAELIKAGKQFDMAVYPDDNHSMLPNGRHNVRQKMVDYILDNL